MRNGKLYLVQFRPYNFRFKVRLRDCLLRFAGGDGSDLVVNDTSIGRIGQLSCWEHLQPLSKYAMYSQNEQIHCAAWPNLALYRGGAYALGHEVNNAASQIYAVEGGCYVIAACALVTPECSGNSVPRR